MIDIVVLHGSSAVGKTHMMKSLLAEDPTLAGWEVDDCKYWLDYEPELGRVDLQRIDPRIDDAAFSEFMDLYLEGPPGRRRSVAFLITKLRDLVSDDPDALHEKKTVIATVGALPPPPDPTQRSVYAWLSQRLPITFCHVLIEIPEDQHLEQMRRRGRLHLRDEILANYSRRVARRAYHDVVIGDLDGLRAVMTDRGWRTGREEHRAEIERHEDETSDA